MDGIDPSFAPGVGTPEPFGLNDVDVRYLIRKLSRKIYGFDVLEFTPDFRNFNFIVWYPFPNCIYFIVFWKGMGKNTRNDLFGSNANRHSSWNNLRNYIPVLFHQTPREKIFPEAKSKSIIMFLK